MHDQIRAELELIEPFDSVEREHHADALSWVNSGAELFRLQKPATPPKHLVSYFAVVDVDSILLVDHRKAQLWLPAGGHVEPQEHPRTTVQRELEEELGFSCPHPVEPPVMVTCTPTVGLTAGHIDVSLWYVVRVKREQSLNYDEGEFLGVRWFPFSQVPLERSDPHMGRFIAKLGSSLSIKGPCSGGLRPPTDVPDFKTWPTRTF